MPVRVKDVTAKCLLDTGAEYSVVSTRLAAQLRLALESAGRRQFANDVTLTIAGMALPHQRVMVMPFDTYYQRGREIDGLLGYELFSRFVVRIDYRGKMLTLWQPSAFKPPHAAVAVPLEFAGHLPVIVSRVIVPGGRTLDARLMVDTGASQAVILRYPFAAEHDLFDPAGMTTTENSLADGPRKLQDIAADSVAVAKWTFDRPHVQAFAEPAGSGGAVSSDGLIGNALLSRFTLYVDYPHGRLLFEPRRH